MRILLVTFGTFGDVNPYVGIGRALRQRGHDVRLATNPFFASMVTNAGLTFVPFGSDAEYRALLGDRGIWDCASGLDTYYLRAVVPALRLVYDVVVEQCDVIDLVVASSLSLGARVAQDRFDIPTVTLHLYPDVFYEPHVHEGVRQALNELRTELDLPPVELVSAWWHSPDRVVCAFPHWLPTNVASFPAQVRFCGFPRYDSADVDMLSEPLQRFLDDGDPPIVFNPGSGMWHGERFFAESIDACALMGRRGVLLTRRREQLPKELPEFVHHSDYAPFDELLPRCAAMVYHGGVGTAASALAAGVPHLVMPMAFDQPSNAIRLTQLGVAKFLEPEDYLAAAVADALGKLIGAPDVAAKCAMLRRLVRSEDALQQTTSVIEEEAASAGHILKASNSDSTRMFARPREVPS